MESPAVDSESLIHIFPMSCMRFRRCASEQDLLDSWSPTVLLSTSSSTLAAVLLVLDGIYFAVLPSANDSAFAIPHILDATQCTRGQADRTTYVRHSSCFMPSKDG